MKKPEENGESSGPWKMSLSLKESEYALNEGGYIILNEAAGLSAMKFQAGRRFFTSSG